MDLDQENIRLILLRLSWVAFSNLYFHYCFKSLLRGQLEEQDKYSCGIKAKLDIIIGSNILPILSFDFSGGPFNFPVGPIIKRWIIITSSTL